MVSLLIQAYDQIHPTPSLDYKVSKKGMIIDVRSNASIECSPKERLPYYVHVHISDAAMVDIMPYIGGWMREIDFEVVDFDSLSDDYRIKAYNTLAAINDQNVVGKGDLTIDQVEGFLTKWNASLYSTGFNEIVFDSSIYSAAISEGFLIYDVNSYDLVFNEESYIEATGVHTISLDYSNTTWGPSPLEKHLNSIATVLDHDAINKIITYQVSRNTIFQAFKENVRDRLRDRLSRSRYYITENVTDAIISAGGEMTVTFAQLLGYIKDRVTE